MELSPLSSDLRPSKIIHKTDTSLSETEGWVGMGGGVDVTVLFGCTNFALIWDGVPSTQSAINYSLCLSAATNLRSFHYPNGIANRLENETDLVQ